MTALDAFALGDRQIEAASYPIETAPKVDDAELLLWPGRGDYWVIGYWSDAGGYSEDGFEIKPIARAPLPAAPVAP